MKKNRLLIPVLAIFIVALCLCSVSAVESNQFNSTVKTVYDDSQLDNVVVDEINTADDDSNSIDEKVTDLDDMAPENKDISLNPDTQITPEEDYVKKNAYVYFDCEAGVEDSIVTITPFIVDSKYVGEYNVISGGTLKIYNKYSNFTTVVDLENCTSFDFKVPECPDSLRSKSCSFYCTFDKYDDENNIHYHFAGYLPFYSMNTNNLNISAKGKGNYMVINKTINVREGDSIIIKLDNIDYWECSPISIHVEGMDKTFGSFTNLWKKEIEIKLDPNEFPAGEYTFYADYGGYIYDNLSPGNGYFVPATSNKITIKVNPINQ